MESKRIRRVVFTFDNGDSFRYDVNQNIRIFDLKRIIETALNIPRLKINLCYKGVSYTNLNDSKIEELFPDLNEIIFKVSYNPFFNNGKSEEDIALKLILGYNCRLHENKYPCFFCFDCNESFCSICNKNKIHADHENIEKYDYLQEPDLVIERMFKKLTDEVYSLRFDIQEQVNLIDGKLKRNYFENLRDLLIKIEERSKDLIRIFFEVNSTSLKQIKQNLKTIKDKCRDVLNSKKNELEMQNIIIDDSIIISYYNAILQIYNQKQQIYNDIKKYLNSIKSFDCINDFLDNFSRNINKSLQDILNKNEDYIFFENEIKKYKIKPLNYEDIKTSLSRDIINSTNKKPVSHKKYFSDTSLNSIQIITSFDVLDKTENYKQFKKLDFSCYKNHKNSSFKIMIDQEFINNDINKEDYGKLNQIKKDIIENRFLEPISCNNDKYKILKDQRYSSNNVSTYNSSSINVFSQLRHLEEKVSNNHQPFKISYCGKYYFEKFY